MGRWMASGLASILVVASAAAQAIERVSVSSAGVEADDRSFQPRMSQDGRFVAFYSFATNLVANDTNAANDAFVRDRVLQTTERVSIGNQGQQAGSSFPPELRISADGRYVLFSSNALDPGDTDAYPDVYLRDRVAGTTTWITADDSNFSYFSYDMSADGRTLVLPDEHPASSLEVRNLATGQTWLLTGVVSTPTVDGHSYFAGVLSGDGRFLFYHHGFYPTSGAFFGTIERLELATGATSVLLSNISSETPYLANGDGRHLLYTEFGFGLSGNTRLHRLDTQTLASERIDVRSLPPPPFGFQGSGVREGALSTNGAIVAFTSDDDRILPGDLNPWHNAFVRVPAQHGTLRVDFDAAGQDTDGDSSGIALSGDGGLVAFDSSATTLVAGDTNLASDIFVRAVCGDHRPDLDGDGYGDSASAAALQCLPAPAGWSVSALDCDDANAQIHPGLVDLCDGVDQDCDGAIDEDAAGHEYCSPSYSSSMCAGVVVGSGCPSAAASSGYTVTGSYLDAQRSCSIFYGLTAMAAPWGTSGLNWMCVAPPRQRTPVFQSGGTAGCSGGFSLDLWAWIAAHPGALGTPLTPGQTLYIQGWFRDAASSTGTSLLRPWTVDVAP